MTDLTFLEIHLHDASFTANAPGSGLTASEESSSGGVRRFLPGRRGSGEATAEPETEGGTNPLPKLLAFVGIVLLAVLASRLMRGEKEPVPA